jgi:acyl carrier protein
VRGRYLSSGYWLNEVLTAEYFTDDSQSGLRTFHSSDQARINADGLLEFRGRSDAQVKVRGFRVDLADVTNALLSLPSVERAITTAQVAASGDTRLVAYLTIRNNMATSAATLRNKLRAFLPSQMIPQAFIFLDSFPLTPHGKVDLEKLSQMHPLAGRAVTEAPKTETELLVAGFWREAFDLSEIGRQDDFFDLGGDSLSGAVIAARIYDALGVELNLSVFTEHPTLAALAAAIDAKRGPRDSSDRAPLIRASRERPLPLSFHQERILKYSRTPEQSAEYVMVGRHGIEGPLDVEILRECMNYLSRRHEILRTTFHVVDGQPIQRVHPPAPVSLAFFDTSGSPDPEEKAAELRRKEFAEPMDLTQLPLLRFMIVKIHEREHVLYRIGHHILFDGWSWNIYFRELGMLYEAKVRGEAPPLPEFEPLQYADYSVWQRDALRPDRPAYRSAVAWWKAVLRGRPLPIELPFKRRKPVANLDPNLGILTWEIPHGVSERLDELGRTEAATAFVLRLAGFVALLARSTGERDVVIGSYLSNRNRVVLQNIFGFFANLATLRFRFDPDRTFREWLTDVRATVTAAEAHGDVPYEELSRELSAQRATLPEIRVIFNMLTYHPALRFADLQLTFGDRREQTMPWGFTIRLDPWNRSNGCRANFDAGIYDPAGVCEFVERYKKLLDAVSRQPDVPLRKLF